MAEDSGRFFFRFALLLALGATGLGAVAARSWYLVGPGRERYLALGKKLAGCVRTYYPPRARILDADGTVLAWTEDYYDLEYTPRPEGLAEPGCEALQQAFPGVNPIPGVLKPGLSPDEIARFEACLAEFPEFQLRLRRERLRVADPAWRARLGEVETSGPRQRGVSGLEKLYETELAGTPGEFEIMLDRRREWIDSSLRLLRRAVPGHDIRLPLAPRGEP